MKFIAAIALVMLFSACCCCQSWDDNPSRIGSRRKIDIGTGAPSGRMAALAYIEGTATLKPVTGAGGHGMGGGFKYSSDFAWFQFPDTDLSTAGAKTVALSSCPPPGMSVSHLGPVAALNSCSLIV